MSTEPRRPFVDHHELGNLAFNISMAMIDVRSYASGNDTVSFEQAQERARILREEAAKIESLFHG